MPAQQIASEQALVEVPRANSDIGHIYFQSGSQLEGHASHTYDFDRSSIGARDILSRLLSYGQPVGVRPLLGQQGDGHSGVNHQEALSGLALGLVTPRDLLRSNADRMCGWCHGCFWASVGSGRGLAALSLPEGMRTYFMTRALGALGRTPSGSASGVFGSADGGVMTGAVITWRTLSSTFLAMDTMALWAAVGVLCTDSSSYSIAYPVPLPVSLSVRLVITEVS